MNHFTRRAKLMKKEKVRALRFMKRRSGLVNKAQKLSTHCGVDACMIINAPKGINNNVDLVWSSSSDSGATLPNLFHKYKLEEQRKAKSMLPSLNKANCEASKFSTWNSKFESMKEHELRNWANDLEFKIENMKSRRDELLKNKGVSMQVDQLLGRQSAKAAHLMSMVRLHSEAIVRNHMKMA
ncbi:hypothetical protein POM88_033201 [Heracleum sosnowskyi]|uniref:MADS-box domain-containing protein n=1 Tax=Heracleum sosnowskyi TaxID=360622 RepID=A0AAD8I342_9APIA|nr:hypothetical protein POM88_033201 [Heracleum sosnowskyi]